MHFTRDDGPVGHPDGSTTSPPPPAALPPRWRRYVATGDSFSEGLWDVPGLAPDVDPPTVAPTAACRGWADLLAAHLADRGALLGPILTEQVPRAVELGADLVSLVGGGNDLLRPATDPDELAGRLEDAVARLRATGADVLLGTGVDAKDSPLVSRTRGRVAVYNTHIWSIARRHGAHVVDLWGMRSLRDWRMWAPDRIHLTSDGHRRVAQGALVALGLAPDDVRVATTTAQTVPPVTRQSTETLVSVPPLTAPG